jgi:hypothetical protein
MALLLRLLSKRSACTTRSPLFCTIVIASIFQTGQEIDTLANIQFWSVDKFHTKKHRKQCPRNPHTHRRLMHRLWGLKTSASEQVFAWFRKYAYMFNSKSPMRQRFAVLSYCRYQNEHVDKGEATYLNKFNERLVRKKPSTSHHCRTGK